MTSEQFKKIKDDAIETIGNIDMDKLTKTSYTLLGASMGILAYENDLDKKVYVEEEKTVKTEPNAFEIVDRVKGSLIDEKMQEMLKYFVNYMEEMSNFQLTRS